MSNRTALFLYCFCIIVIFFGFYTSADPDLFARLAVGKLLNTTTSLPLHDPFSFTPQKPIWIDHELLSGVVFYRIYDSFGEPGLLIFRLLAASLSISFLLSACSVRGSKLLPLFVVFATIQISSVWLSAVRSQIFTYLFLASLLAILHDAYYNNRYKALSILPPMFCIWCVMHGGFVVGLGILLLFCLGAFLNNSPCKLRLTAALFASVAFTAFNPYGFTTYWNFILQATTMMRPAIDEWSPVMPWSSYALIPDIFLLSLMAIYGLYRGTKIEWVHVLLIMSSLFFGFRHHRLMPIFVMVAVVEIHSLFDLIPVYAQRFINSRIIIPGNMLLVLSFPVLIIAAGISIFRTGFITLEKSDYPVAAVAWIKENRSGGNILVHFDYGSFVIWELYPNFKVSVDGRYEEVYPEETVKTVQDALNGQSPTHLESLEKIDPDLILTDTSVASYPARWKAVFTDRRFTVFQ